MPRHSERKRKIRGTAIGALIGATLIAGSLNSFIDSDHFEIRIVIASLAAVGGGAYGFRYVVQRIRRERGVRQAAQRLGLAYAADAPEAIEQRMRNTFFFGYSSAGMTNAMYRRTGRSRLVIGDMHLASVDADGDSHQNETRTVAYFESKGLQLPKFLLRPEHALMRVALGLMGAGQTDIDFESHPHFSQQYHLSAVHVQWTRELFNPKVLKYFAAHRGFEVQAEENRLIVFHPHGTCEPRELKQFAKQAVRIFRLLRRASRKVQPDETELKPDARAAAEKLAGPFGAVVRATLVSRSDVTDLLRQSPPRTIPPNFRRQWIGCGSLFAVLVGACLVLGGLVLGLVGGFLVETSSPGDRIWFRSLAVILPLLGLSLALFPWLYHRRQLRLLREGLVTEGTIARVEPTSFYSGGVRRHRAWLRCSAGGVERIETCNLYGEAARAAYRLAGRGKSVRLLYDANRPWIIFWPESLVNVPSGYA
ncbi:MAG: hypothetical protein KY476_05895 [Planctomycetes bacterium]|nr:hypothetical protein [Planctomycetota bacterium]